MHDKSYNFSIDHVQSEKVPYTQSTDDTMPKVSFKCLSIPSTSLMPVLDSSSHQYIHTYIVCTPPQLFTLNQKVEVGAFKGPISI